MKIEKKVLSVAERVAERKEKQDELADIIEKGVKGNNVAALRTEFLRLANYVKKHLG